MKNQKMFRFLTSIGISNPERFDMDFDLVGRDSFDHNFVHMSIRKETPWEETMLEEFKQGLSRINYPYSLRFSYSIEPTFNDVDSLFQDW